MLIRDTTVGQRTAEFMTRGGSICRRFIDLQVSKNIYFERIWSGKKDIFIYSFLVSRLMEKINS